jgi:DNA-binding SARP family transcriptional activator/DNA-binding beta-propeller fold protein YncE
LDFRILGPLEVADDGSRVALGKGKQRALLALLLLNANEVVSIDRLIDELWGERPPATAQTGLHGYVSHLRKLLGSGRIETRGPGYLLRVEEGELDRERFETLARAGRFTEALAVWHGPALADFAHEPWAQAEIVRLEERRLACVEARLDLDLKAGLAAELVGELEALVAANPLRERFRAQLMLALYRSGRQADALNVYREARRTLVDELGIEPGEELKELQKRILAQDAALSAIEPPREQPAPAADFDGGHRPERRGRRALVLLSVLAVLLAAAAAALLLARDEGPPAVAVVGNSVVKIDPQTNRVVGVVPVGLAPVAVASVGQTLWVANRTDDTLTRIDTRSHATRTFGGFDFPISLAAEGPRIWVGSESGPELVGIDAATGSVVERLRVTPGPAGFVAFGEGSLWVSHGVFFPGLRPEGRTAVSRIDVLAREVSTVRLRDGDTTSWIAAGRGAAWVSLTGPGQLLRIDARNGARQRIMVGSGPLGVAVGFGAVWVAAANDDSVRRVNAATGSVEKIVEAGDQPFPVAVGAGSVWVGNHRDGTVLRLDPASAKVVETIRLDFFPTAIHVADGAVWVAVSTERVFDGSTALG